MSQKCLFCVFFFIPFCFSAWHHLWKNHKKILKKIINSLYQLLPFLCLHIPPTPCTEWMCRFIMRLCVCVCCVVDCSLGVFVRDSLWETHTHTHTHPVKFVDPLYIEKTKSRRPDLILEHEERKTKRKPVCAHLFSHYVSKNNKESFRLKCFQVAFKICFLLLLFQKCFKKVSF